MNIKKKKILIDTGFGNKQNEKFRSFFEPHGDISLLNSLAKKGISPKEITDVFMTHFHFDHIGGSLYYDNKQNIMPTFPNATYWTNKLHYDWAFDPNPREKASFLKENFVPLQENGILKYFDVEEQINWFDGFDIRFTYGHTEAMMIPILTINNRKLIYCADLLPSSFHLGQPYVMSYDIRPLQTMDEVTKLLSDAEENNSVLFFEHDPNTECITVGKNEKGKYYAKERFTLNEIF